MLSLPPTVFWTAAKWLEEAVADLIAGTIQIGEHERYLCELAAIEENPVTAVLVTAVLWRWSSAGWQAKPPAPPTSDLNLEM